MSKYDRQKTWLTEQEELWREIDDAALDRAITDDYLAIMDKKPIVMDGIAFLDQEFKEPPYLIEPFFPLGGLGLLHGKGGLGKTFLAMTIMEAICKGKPLFGVYPTTQGRVTYVQLDMTDRIFQDRMVQAGDRYRFEGWNVVSGVANLMAATRDTDWVQKVHMKRPDLIIIDTLRKAHTMPENESDTPNKFFKKVRQLFGAIAIMPLHHDKKTSEHSNDPDEAARGSGAWLTDIDVGMHLIKSRGEMRLEFSKVRTCPEQEPIQVLLDTESMSIVPKDADAISQASRARAAARVYKKDSPKAAPSEVYEFLVGNGFSKPTASRAKEAAFDH